MTAFGHSPIGAAMADIGRKAVAKKNGDPERPPGKEWKGALHSGRGAANATTLRRRYQN